MDPETIYGHADQTTMSNPLESLGEEQMSALGNLAQPGAYIQFFAAQPPQVTQNGDVLRNDHSRRRRFVIGTVPSTIDDVKTPSGDTILGSGGLVVHAGLFGAVSEAGLFTHKSSSRSKDRASLKSDIQDTKIDLPYSRFGLEIPPFVRRYKGPNGSPYNRPLMAQNSET